MTFITSAIAGGCAIETEAETVREIFQRYLKLVAQSSSGKMITGTGGGKTHTTISQSVPVQNLDPDVLVMEPGEDWYRSAGP